jgi:hypothetical protein
MPAANTITAFYEFSAGTLIRSSYVNTNFSNLRGNLLPIDPTATSSPHMTYNLGADGHAWMNNYSGVWVADAQSTPAANPSTTTQYKIYMKSDGSLYKLNSAGAESSIIGSGSLPGTTKGDLPVHDGSATVRFPVGTNGQVLTADSSATSGLKWADVGSKSIVLATAAVSVVNTNDLVICSGTSFTATLFSITGNDNQEIQFLHNGTHLTQVYQIRTNGSDVITTQAGDTTTISMYTNGEKFSLLVSGGKFIITDHFAKTAWVDAGATSLTATGTALAKGTITKDKLYWRRDGQNAQFKMEYNQSAAGTIGTGAYLLVIPSSFTIDTTYFGTSTSLTVTLDARENGPAILPGNGYIAQTSGSRGNIFPRLYSNTQIIFHSEVFFTAGNYWGGSGSFGMNTALGIGCNFLVPIVGWQP